MKSRILNLWVIAIIASSCSLVSAQQQQGNDSNNGIVAVLDVAKVFKNNSTFESKMAAIKQEADGLKARIQGEQNKIREEAMGLQGFEPGSVERNQLEGDLEQRQAALRTKARQSEQDLLNREAKIYYETYVEMQGIVGNLAEKYGISLVLRFDSADIDSTNRAEVIKGVNRAVVYHHKLDLTKMVIQAMTGRTANAGTGTQNK